MQFESMNEGDREHALVDQLTSMLLGPKTSAASDSVETWSTDSSEQPTNEEDQVPPRESTQVQATS